MMLLATSEAEIVQDFIDKQRSKAEDLRDILESMDIDSSDDDKSVKSMSVKVQDLLKNLGSYFRQRKEIKSTTNVFTDSITTTKLEQKKKSATPKKEKKQLQLIRLSKKIKAIRQRVLLYYVNGSSQREHAEVEISVNSVTIQMISKCQVVLSSMVT